MWLEELIDKLNEYPEGASAVINDGCLEILSRDGEHLDSIELSGDA